VLPSLPPLGLDSFVISFLEFWTTPLKELPCRSTLFFFLDPKRTPKGIGGGVLVDSPLKSICDSILIKLPSLFFVPLKFLVRGPSSFMGGWDGPYSRSVETLEEAFSQGYLLLVRPFKGVFSRPIGQSCVACA